MMKNLKTFLILFLSVLILSITPIAAIQNNHDASLKDEDFLKIVQECVDAAIAFASTQEYTELTTEQEDYLNKSSDYTIAQTEGTIINLQSYLDYINLEENKYNPINSQKRGTTNPFEEDLKNIEKYLKAQKIQVNTDKCNYKQLTIKTNEEEPKTFEYSKDKVIIQIKDLNYIRYVQLVNINKTDIIIKSKKGQKNIPKDEFLDYYTLDGDLNVFIVPNGCATDYTLRVITTNQLDLLNSNINYYASINDLLKPMYTTFGIALISTAMLGMINIQGVVRALGAIVMDRYEEQGEAARILPAYRGYIEQGERQGWFGENKRKCIVIGGGMIITIGLALIIHHMSTLKLQWEADKTNLLNEWGA